ncbi:MAG TPA: hypothetical protein VGL33_33345 [Streptosporangiaceae bacterium]
MAVLPQCPRPLLPSPPQGPCPLLFLRLLLLLPQGLCLLLPHLLFRCPPQCLYLPPFPCAQERLRLPPFPCLCPLRLPLRCLPLLRCLPSFRCPPLLPRWLPLPSPWPPDADCSRAAAPSASAQVWPPAGTPARPTAAAVPWPR